MNLEAKGYVATDADVANLVQAVLSAVNETVEGRKSYLRTLIGTTQQQLGAAPRTRKAKAGRSPPLTEEETAEQLRALLAVHERFYAIVLRVAGESIPPGTRERAIEVNRRTNFARTALSAVRRWVRAGGDVTTLVPRSATKASLTVERQGPPRVRSAQALKLRAEVASRTLVSSLVALAESDKSAAALELQRILGQLAGQMQDLGVPTTRDAGEAMRELRPLRMKSTIFIPASSQARPS